MISSDRVLCLSSSELTDGYFQTIPASVFEQCDYLRCGVQVFILLVWDRRGFELRPGVIYCLAPYQSLNMQIVLFPTRAMADSLRPNGSLSLEGTSCLPPPILYTGYFMWANQFICYLSFLSSLNCCCLFQLTFTDWFRADSRSTTC